MNPKGLAQMAMYGGAATALASAFAELQQAQTWAEVMSPPHFFAALGALVMAAGAFFHPSPKGSEE